MALGFAALLGLDQPSRVMLSNILGYTSIACWLCAQFPQVIKNASLRSCEGLALPFLCNWLFGDITNLIGCLLTDQLPFQTYLAAYFCVVDIALVAQYFYYRTPTPPPAPRYFSYSSLTDSPRQTLILPPQSAPPHPHPHHRTRSSSSLAAPALPPPPLTAGPGPAPGRGGGKQGMKRGGSQYFPPDISVTSPPDGSYAAIYSAALDVARAAERASAHSRSRKRKLSRRNTAASVVGESGGEDGADGEGEGEVDGGMLDSFHSEMSGQSGSTTRESPRRGVTHALTGGGRGAGVVDDRGRSMRRAGGPTGSGGGGSGYTSGYNGGASGNTSGNALSGLSSPMLDAHDYATGLTAGGEDDFEGLPAQAVQGRVPYHATYATEDMREWDRKRSKSRSLSLVRGSGGRGGRRAAGMAFMSLGVLVGWGGMRGGVGAGAGAGGVVLERAAPWTVLRHPQIATPPLNSYTHSPEPSTFLFEFPDSPTGPEANNAAEGEGNGGNGNGHPTHEHPPEGSPSFQRIVGRISAWSCTTLYLTSRLPQIWMNFQRKSVEGLSILLFLFAFCGNSTYVTSILLNPAGTADPAESAHYLLEALPYLLGSGGTLVFDLTIMIQSLIYGSAPPVPQPPTPLDRSARRRILSSRRRVRHLEDGWGSGAVSQERGSGSGAGLPNGGGVGAGERQALLGISGLSRRERSVSPQVSTRRTRGSSAVRA
ncbi:hypothetical protein IAT38_000433 [Cryptococcus sp. DSM 104549]